LTRITISLQAHIYGQKEILSVPQKKLLGILEEQFDKETYQIVATGTTGSARNLVGAMVGATMVKNEITAHAIGTTTLYPDVRTILEIGGQDSKIILVENGVAIDYAMNTLCAAVESSECHLRRHYITCTDAVFHKIFKSIVVMSEAWKRDFFYAVH
jgi:activator of 2-hydroxyglutaryl-CoA dehydratase